MKHRLLFALIMGTLATCIISFTLVCVNYGFGTNFLFIWLRSWTIAFLVAFPLLIFVAPKIQKFVAYLLQKREND